jgi:hypothetical protein
MRQDEVDEITPDKPCATGDDQRFHCPPYPSR